MAPIIPTRPKKIEKTPTELFLADIAVANNKTAEIRTTLPITFTLVVLRQQPTW